MLHYIKLTPGIWRQSGGLRALLSGGGGSSPPRRPGPQMPNTTNYPDADALLEPFFSLSENTISCHFCTALAIAVTAVLSPQAEAELVPVGGAAEGRVTGGVTPSAGQRQLPRRPVRGGPAAVWTGRVQRRHRRHAQQRAGQPVGGALPPAAVSGMTADPGPIQRLSGNFPAVPNASVRAALFGAPVCE